MTTTDLSTTTQDWALAPSQRPVVISLCDLTGNMARPWLEAGHDAVLVDPQHGTTHVTEGGRVLKIAATIEDAMGLLALVLRHRRVVMVFGFPPCTDLAGSGAKHFQRKMTDKAWKHYRGPNMWYDALRVVWQCENVGQLAGAPWMVENPVGRLSTFWRKPNHLFDPHDFTAYEPADNYTKRTCLWTGNGFVMPEPARDTTLGAPDNRIHFASPGPERANFRSATPMGFARAVFAANRPAAAAVTAA